jgi:hypothetical protein
MFHCVVSALVGVSFAQFEFYQPGDHTSLSTSRLRDHTPEKTNDQYAISCCALTSLGVNLKHERFLARKAAFHKTKPPHRRKFMQLAGLLVATSPLAIGNEPARVAITAD